MGYPAWLTHIDNKGVAAAAVITVTTANATYPASNLKILPVTKVWRSTSVAAAQDIEIDLSAAQTISLAALVNHNISSAGTIAIAAGTTSAVADFSTTATQRDFLAFKRINPSQSYRYWRFRITDTGNADGYIEVGYIMLGNLTASEFGIQMGWKSTPEFWNLEVESEFGMPNVEELYRRQRLSMEFGPALAADMTTMRNMYIAVKRNLTPLILLPDVAGTDAYFGRIQNMFEESLDVYRYVHMDFVEDGYGKRISA